MKDLDKKNELQEKATVAKDRLIEIEGELRDEGFVRLANELSTLIWRLEYWQHK